MREILVPLVGVACLFCLCVGIVQGFRHLHDGKPFTYSAPWLGASWLLAILGQELTK